MNGLPESMDLGLAGEINFAIVLFRELPVEEQSRLATTLKENPENSESYANAALEIFKAITASPERLTRHMNEAFYGKGRIIFDGWFIWPKDFPKRVRRCARYFRENLNGTNIEEIPLTKSREE